MGDEAHYPTIIAGSRHITEMAVLEEAIRASGFEITEVVSGKAPGPDTLGEEWAKQRGIHVEPFPADWENLEAEWVVRKTRRDGTVYNAVAGLCRNQNMARYAADRGYHGKAGRGQLIALWDGRSPGTKHMITEGQRAGLAVYVYEVRGKVVKV